MQLTCDELEVQAYIKGEVKLAKLYAKYSDLEALEYETEKLERETNDLERENDYLSSENYELEKDIEYWRERAIKAEATIEVYESSEN